MNVQDIRGICRHSNHVPRLALLGMFLVGGLVVPLTVLAEPITLSGITEPYQDVALGIAVAGRIAKIHAPEGSKVAKGDVLLELDKKHEELEVERRRLLWQSKSEVEAATQQVKTLEAHVKASRALYAATGSVNREELENQELECELARIDLARLETAEQREELEYGIAKEELNKRSLRAPFAGSIVELLVGVGENCEQDKPLIQLVDASRGYFVTHIELSTMNHLKLGKMVDLQLQSENENVDKKAEIIFISPVVDSASGLRKIKARFDNTDGKIVPGVTGIMLLQAE